MALFRYVILTIATTLGTFLCHAHRHHVSIDTLTHQQVIVLDLNVGDSYYRELGKVTITREGTRYFITFPFILYKSPPKRSDPPEYTVMPKGTVITILLENGDTIMSVTKQDISLDWHYWEHFSVGKYSRKTHESYVSAPQIYLYRQEAPKNFFKASDSDIYGLSWKINFEFTAADMARMSHSGIVKAFIVKDREMIKLPLRHKQAAKMKRSVALLIK